MASVFDEIFDNLKKNDNSNNSNNTNRRTSNPRVNSFIKKNNARPINEASNNNSDNKKDGNVFDTILNAVEYSNKAKQITTQAVEEAKIKTINSLSKKISNLSEKNIDNPAIYLGGEAYIYLDEIDKNTENGRKLYEAYQSKVQKEYDNNLNSRVETVTNKIKSDPGYFNELVDSKYNLIDYSKDIQDLESIIKDYKDKEANAQSVSYDPDMYKDALATLQSINIKEVNDKLDYLKEIQEDQKALLYTAQYEQLKKLGASEDDLLKYQIRVNEQYLNLPERAATNLSGTIEHFVYSNLKGIDTLNQMVANGYGIDLDNDGTHFNKVIDNAEYYLALTKSQAGDVEKVIYDVYDGMAPFLYSMMLSGSLLGIATGGTSALGNTTYGEVLKNMSLLMSDMSVLGSQMKNNISNGYDINTSTSNAFFHAALSHLTETIGGESIANILTGEIGTKLLSNTLGYATKALTNQFLAEATEEGVEAAIEPIIDNLTLNKNMTVEQYLNQVISSDTLYQMLIGGLGGLAMGAGATANTIMDFNSEVNMLYNSISEINTKEEYNAAKTVSDYLENLIDKSSDDNTTLKDAIALNKAYKKKMAEFKIKNPHADAILTNDKNIDLSTGEETVINASRPTLDDGLGKIVALKEMLNAQSQEELNNISKILEEKDIKIDNVDLTSLTKEQLDELEVTNKYVKSLGVDVLYSDMLDEDGKIIDGLYDNKNKRIVINPRSNEGALSTLIHELTHGTEDSEFYKDLYILTKEYYGNNYKNALKDIKKRYQNYNADYEKELVASTTQKLLKSPEYVDRLVNYNKSLAYRMYEEIKHLNEQTGTVDDIEYNFMRAFYDVNNQVQENVKETQAQFAFTNDYGKELEFNKDELQNNRNEVLNLKPITINDNTNIAVSDGKNIRDKIYDFYEKNYNNEIYANSIDTTVKLNKRGIKNDLAHGMSRIKSKGFVGVPEVLKKGLVTDLKNNYGGKTEDRIIVSAPVTIDGTDFIESVVLRQTNKTAKEKTTHLYLHDIVLINKKSGSLSFIQPDLSLLGTWATKTTSTDSVSKTLDNVNEKKDTTHTGSFSKAGDAQGRSSSLNLSTNDTIVNNLTQQEIDTYNKAIKSGDMETAQRIVNKAAKNAGYSSNSDYQGTSAFNGSAPSNQGWYETIDEAIEAWNNDEFEGPATLGMYKKHGIDINDLDFFLNDNRAYRNGSNFTKESIKNLRDVVNNDKDTITMYRSVPIGIKENSFRNGDWITPSKSYAEDNANVHSDYSGWENGYRIIEQEVPIDDIWWDGNDINEWGYDNGNNYAYKNTPNNIKSLDTVTYDENGNPVPIEQRFDESKSSIQFSVGSLANGTSYVILDNEQKREDGTQKSKKEIFNDLVGKHITFDGEEIEVVKNLRNKGMFDELFRRLPKIDEELPFSEKLIINEELNNNMLDIIKASKETKPFTPDTDERHKNQQITGFYTRTVPVYNEQGARLFELTVAELTDGRKIAYAKRYLSKVDQKLTELIENNKKQVGHPTPASINSISNDEEIVNKDITVNANQENIQNKILNEDDNPYESWKSKVQSVSDKANKELLRINPETGDILTVDNIDDILHQKKINQKTLKAIENTKQILKENIADWVYGYDTIKAQYPMFSNETLSNAVYELLIYEELSDSTYDMLANDLSQAFDYEGINEDLKEEINNFVNETLETFSNEVKYQAGEVDKSRVKEVIKVNEAYNQKDIEGVYKKREYNSYINELSSKTKEHIQAEYQPLTELLIKHDGTLREKKNRPSDRRINNLMTIDQVMKSIANGDLEVYKSLREKLRYNLLDNAANRIFEIKNSAQVDIVNKIKDLGIVEGSKESVAVQYILEGHTENYLGKDEGKNGYQVYNEENLKQDYDYKMENGKFAYENILDAANLIRNSYFNLYEELTLTQLIANGDVEGNAELEIAEAKTKVENAWNTLKNIKDEIKKNGSKPSTQAAYEIQKKKYNSLLKQFNNLSHKYATGELTRRDLTPFREDFSHHINKRNLKNTISSISNSDFAVPTELSGISDFTKPNTAWSNISLPQDSIKYTPDALASYVSYVNEVANIIAYNPVILEIRQFNKNIKNNVSGTTLNRFSEYLNDYANMLAGKRDNIDRSAQKLLGAKTMKTIKALNAYAKSAALVMNFRSGLVQFANIPNGLGILQERGGKGYISDVALGLRDYAASLNKNVKLLNGSPENDISPISKSAFMSNRYFDFDTGKKGISTKLNDVSKAILQKGDKIAAEVIWHCAYEQALRLNESNPILYADDLTRNAIAGRSKEDMSIASQSEVLNLLFPFQIETINQFNTLKEQLSNKNYGPLINYSIAAFIFNMIVKGITNGDDEVLPEFVTPIYEEIKKALKGDQDVNQTAQNILMGELAEFISFLPASSTITQLIFGEDSESVFADYNPNRYGFSNIGLSGIGNIVKNVIKDTGDIRKQSLDVIENLVSGYLKGGKQLMRSIKGIQSMGGLPEYKNSNIETSPVNYNRSNKPVYVNDQSNIMDWIRASLFGKYSTSEARKYVEGGFKPLSTSATNVFDALKQSGVSSYDSFINAKEYQENKANKEDKTLREQLKESGQYDDFKKEIEKSYDSYLKNFDYSEGTPRSFNQYVNSYGLSSEDLKLDTYDDFYRKYKLSKSSQKAFEEAISIENVKDSNNNTIANSAAALRRIEFEKAGIYEDVLEYIEKNNLDYSDFGLTKSIVEANTKSLNNILSKINEVTGNDYSYKKETDNSSTSSKTLKSQKKAMIKFAQGLSTGNSSNVFSGLNDILSSATSIDDVKKKIKEIQKKYS